MSTKGKHLNVYCIYTFLIRFRVFKCNHASFFFLGIVFLFLNQTVNKYFMGMNMCVRRLQGDVNHSSIYLFLPLKYFMCLIEYFMTWKIPKKKDITIFCSVNFLHFQDSGVCTFHGRKFSIFFFSSALTELYIYETAER